MKTILEETQELMKEAINTITKLECVYEDLIKQRDNVKSNTLKQLLNTELWEYISFTEAIIKYLQLYNRKKNKDLENTDTFFKNSIETVKTIKNKQMALNIEKMIQSTYLVSQKCDDMDAYIINFAIKNYLNIINRNFKNWGEFAKILGNKITDIVIDEIPGISEIKDLYQNIKDTAELMNEFEDNATDYSEVDKKLFEIENHILIMQLSKALTEESIKILENNNMKNL